MNEILVTSPIPYAVLGALSALLAFDWIARGRRIWMRRAGPALAAVALGASLGAGVAYWGIPPLHLHLAMAALASWSASVILFASIALWRTNLADLISLDPLLLRLAGAVLVGGGPITALALGSFTAGGTLLLASLPLVIGGLHRAALAIRAARLPPASVEALLAEVEERQKTRHPWVATIIEIEQRERKAALASPLPFTGWLARSVASGHLASEVRRLPARLLRRGE